MPLLSPMRDRGADTMSICSIFGSTEACRAKESAGDSTELHWVWYMVVAMSGYSKDFLIVVW